MDKCDKVDLEKEKRNNNFLQMPKNPAKKSSVTCKGTIKVVRKS